MQGLRGNLHLRAQLTQEWMQGLRGRRHLMRRHLHERGRAYFLIRRCRHLKQFFYPRRATWGMSIRVVSATVLQAHCCKLHRKWAAGNLGQHHRKDTSRACPAAGPRPTATRRQERQPSSSSTPSTSTTITR